MSPITSKWLVDRSHRRLLLQNLSNQNWYVMVESASMFMICTKQHVELNQSEFLPTLTKPFRHPVPGSKKRLWLNTKVSNIFWNRYQTKVSCIKPKLSALSNLKCVTLMRQSIYKPLSLILHPFHDIVQLRRLSITNY